MESTVVQDGAPSPSLIVYLLLEVGLAALGLVVLKRAEQASA